MERVFARAWGHCTPQRGAAALAGGPRPETLGPPAPLLGPAKRAADPAPASSDILPPT